MLFSDLCKLQSIPLGISVEFAKKMRTNEKKSPIPQKCKRFPSSLWRNKATAPKEAY